MIPAAVEQHHNPIVRRFFGALIAILGLFLIATTVFNLTGGTFANAMSTSILYASFGVLLLGFAGYLLFA